MSDLINLPDDFKRIAEEAKQADIGLTPDPGPVYYLWVFDPQDDKVIIEHNKDKHHADHVDHTDLAQRVPHPERIHGYAYRIVGGWRITDYDHKAVDDPHIKKLIEKKLNEV